jgi:hypoxanthine phosphoribosyltransferase
LFTSAVLERGQKENIMTELHPELERVLISEAEVQSRIRELAAQLSVDYANSGRLYLVGILKGSFLFLADLARRLTIPHTVDFMAVSSYGQRGTKSGEVRLLMDLREPITGADVLIVEDIVDSGKTLHYLYETLGGRQPASLRTCAFVHKERDQLPVPVDYLGFTIPDVWVVGYGLDYAERFRTLPFVAELSREVYAAHGG